MATEVEIKRSYGKDGKADIRITGQKVKVFFEDENGAAREFLVDDVPEGVKAVSGVYVSLNSGGDKVFGIRPYDEKVLVKFKRFVRNQEGFVNIKEREPKHHYLPAKGSQAAKSWDDPARLTFTAILEIVTPAYSWMEIPLTLDHVFEKGSNGMMKLTGAPKYVKVMQKFLELSGFDFASDSVPYGETLLDELEELLLERDMVWEIKLENGWPRTKTMDHAAVGANTKRKKAAPKKTASKKAK